MLNGSGEDQFMPVTRFLYRHPFIGSPPVGVAAGLLLRFRADSNQEAWILAAATGILNLFLWFPRFGPFRRQYERLAGRPEQMPDKQGSPPPAAR